MKGTFWRLLKFTFPLKNWILLAVLLGFLTIAASIGLMTTSAYLISKAALHPSIEALGVAIVGVRFFGIARGLFRYLERYVSHEVTFRLLGQIRVWFYSALEPLAPARLQQYRSGDLLSRIVGDIETLQYFYGRVIAPPLVAAVIAVAMWFFLGAFSPVFAFIFIGFFLLAGVGVPLLAFLLGRKLGSEIILVRAELNAQMVDGIQGMAELVAFGQEQRQLAKVRKLTRRVVKLQDRLAWVTGLQTALGNLLMNLAAWTMLVVAIPMVQEGKLDGVFMALLVLAALSSFEAVLPLPTASQQLGSSLEAAKRLFHIVDAPPVVTLPTRKSPTPRHYGISAEHLSFSYKPGEAEALHDVSFSLPPGKRLAIVGASGSGKTTLANLLLRFWDYGDGKLELGENDLREYSPEALQKLIAVVSQNTHLFNTTIRQNLMLARPDATREELEDATRQAQIHDFICSLPDAYETQIGEQGLKLSGGERQRLAIARALLKNAPILILDEATANLDTLTERNALTAIHTLMQGRTTITISHRLIDMDKADEILVLKDGQVVERGTHYQLLQCEGWYWRMWELQNQHVNQGLSAVTAERM